MSTSVETPRDVVEQLFLELPSRDAGRFAARMAPAAVFEIPFPIPGQPTRIEGREEIRDYLASRWSGTPGIELHGIRPTIHETTEPGLFVTECDIDITRPGAGREWVRSSVNVIRVEDGLVTLFRDYMDTGRIQSMRMAAERAEV
ncbi:nuclear transport factor 2 family protein [Nocardia terrae]|uniref:nuclear transport factor 2 family protein n=1 Tax=Nocardia terrae TaxID=2675851 RepID=UPI0012F806E8|nr:nuclear transport factor 2 family protein [Nocardia terrae]